MKVGQRPTFEQPEGLFCHKGRASAESDQKEIWLNNYTRIAVHWERAIQTFISPPERLGRLIFLRCLIWQRGAIPVPPPYLRGLAFGFALGLAFGFAFALTFGLAFAFGLAFGLGFAFGFGLALGLSAGFGAGMVGGAISGTGGGVGIGVPSWGGSVCMSQACFSSWSLRSMGILQLSNVEKRKGLICTTETNIQHSGKIFNMPF